MLHALKYNRLSRWDLKFLGVSLTRRFAPGYKYFAPAGAYHFIDTSVSRGVAPGNKYIVSIGPFFFHLIVVSSTTPGFENRDEYRFPGQIGKFQNGRLK
jgi:hypothetical protein